jgi:hypothetical protein
MAAGLGFKDFTTGEVLTAADVDGYLMQNIWVFATATARDAAVTSPQEGNFAFTKDNNSLWYYDGAAWVASGATGDIEGVTAGIGISGGGTSGTVTVTNSMATAIDAKGDLVVGTGADTFAKLTVGANNTILTADSAEATGLKWASPAGGGKVLQVVQATTATSTQIASTSYTDTGLTGTITPTLNTSKILVMATQGFGVFNSPDSGNFAMGWKLARNIGGGAFSFVYTPTPSNNELWRFGTVSQMRCLNNLVYLDSPATTSAVIYKTQAQTNSTANSQNVTFQNESVQTSTLIMMEIGA